MSTICLQPNRFIEGLPIEILMDDETFKKFVKTCEENYLPDRVYWDGSPFEARDAEIRRIRRRIEDRIRKDRHALKRAFQAIYPVTEPTNMLSGPEYREI